MLQSKLASTKSDALKADRVAKSGNLQMYYAISYLFIRKSYERILPLLRTLN